MSGLCAFSFERLLSTTNKSAHQRNFFSSYFSFLHRHGPVLCPRPFYYGCLQNEVLRPKTLSNLGQSNRAKTFPQTPTDRESVGLRFIDQAGSNCKTKTLAQMLFSTSMDTKSMGLPFIDQAGSNYYTWTLAQMLCSMSTDTKSMGLRFVDQAGSNYKTKTRLSLVWKACKKDKPWFLGLRSSFCRHPFYWSLWLMVTMEKSTSRRHVFAAYLTSVSWDSLAQTIYIVKSHPGWGKFTGCPG